ncbi:Hypothetical predicted protein [Pelobates cultripes]|uniref:Reverse transcriptase n=1 Tax=Pelobates cultripes TaxID=61616 RepID=A0AAD1SUH2_PELCU|nr:Hypothetical predicted protein [Pelobates cultripes]
MPNEYNSIKIFADLSADTLQFRKSMAPITSTLREHDLNYRWGFPAKLLISHQGAIHAITTLKQSSYLKKHRQATLMEYQRQLTQLTTQNKGAPSRALALQIQNLLDKITELRAVKTSYMLHKLKATHYHHSGKATKLNRLRAKLAATKIAHIQDPEVKHGGMAFPNVKAYYQAAALTPLLTHLVRNNQPQWVHLENLAVKPFAIHILTWLHKSNRPTTPLLPLQVQLALQIWDTHRRKFETANPLSMATPIEAITYCIPTFHAMPWKDKGISHLAQVFESDSRNETTIASALSTWEQTGITGKLPQTFKPLSGCYRLILPYQSLSDSTPAHQWEMDLQTPITEKQWSSITSSTRKLIKSAPLIEQHQKTIYRWYMKIDQICSPYQLTTPENNISVVLCRTYRCTAYDVWRCKQEKDSVLHIWWKCPRLIRYWEDTGKIIADTTTIHLPFDPKTFLLLDIPRETPTQARKLMYHVLLTAQKLIARLWKTTDTPSIPALIQDIDKQAIYETSFSKAQNSTKCSGSTWEQWRAWRKANAQHVPTNHNLK